MRTGSLYPRPTSAPLTAASESSSSGGLLPTPSANQYECAPEVFLPRRARQKDLGRNGNGFGLTTAMAVALLRTPTAQLAENGGSQHPDKRKAGGHGPTLADEVEHLLPTPQAHDAVKGKTAVQVEAMRQRGRTQGHAPGVSNLNEVAENHLLPTPSVALATGGQTSRSGDRIGEPLLPAIAKSMTSTGVPTSQPSSDGNTSSDGQLPGQLSLDELENG